MKIPDNELSRRGFLTTASSLVAAGLTAFPAGSLLAQVDKVKPVPTPPRPYAPKPIISRTLGRTGIEIPVVNMGVMNADVPDVVQASYEEGVRHFDTAATYQYGKNEEMVGNAIRKLGVRDKVIIATKEMSPEVRRGLSPKETSARLIEMTEGSLRRLKTDYIDILYIHSLSKPGDVVDPGLIEGMNRLKLQKKIRFSGVTTHGNMAAIISKVAETGGYDVVLTVVNFALASEIQLFEAIKNASDKGIGLIGMKPFWGSPDQLATENAEWLKKYSSATIVGAAMKWVLKNAAITCVIPGYTNFEHMRQNFAVARDLEYSHEEKKFLNDRGMKLGFNFCHQCGTCLASCPNDVDIPTLMRTHMYATQYGNFCQARITLDTIEKTRGIQNCRACEVCSVKCINSVNIARKIKDLKLIYA